MKPIASGFVVEELLAQASWIRALARQLLRDDSAAEDLAQEAMVAALEHRPATDRALRPWLATVMRNRLSWLARGKRSQLQREERVAREEALPSSADLVARGESQQRLVAAVVALDDPYRSLLLLRFYEGLEPAEIARRRQVSAGTVRGQLSRAVAMLRERLDATNEEAQIEWRLALLPLVEDPSKGSIMTSLSLPTLTVMHSLPKLLIAASLILGGFLVSNQLRETDSLGGANESVAASTALPSIDGTEKVGAESSAELPDPKSDHARLVVQAESEDEPMASRGSVVDGVVLVKEPGGELRPLEDFLVLLSQAGGESESVRTDAAGEFRSEGLYEPGTIEFKTPDHEDLDRHNFYGHLRISMTAPESPSIEFQPGEIIELVLVPRREFNVQLAGPTEAVESLEDLELWSPSFAESMGMALSPGRLIAPLRQGRESAPEQVWVRFAPSALVKSDGAWLYAKSSDGLWAAKTRTPEQTNFDAVPLRLTLVPAARVEVSIPWPGSDEPNGIQVQIRPVSHPTSQAEMELVSTEGERSVFSRGGIEPGSYLLSALAEGTPLVFQEIELRAGETKSVTLDLDFAPELFPLTLELTSDSGLYHGAALFQAQDLSRSLIFTGEIPTWEQDVDGNWIGTHHVGMVPAGEYTVQLLFNEPLRAWETTDRRVVVPGPALEIMCFDAGDAVDLSLKAVDSATAKEIEGARFTLQFNEEVSNLATQVGSQALWRDVRLSPEPRWTVEAEGYKSRSGDWSTFEQIDRERFVEVALERESD